jgi:hypothetical protein
MKASNSKEEEKRFFDKEGRAPISLIKTSNLQSFSQNIVQTPPEPQLTDIVI